MENRYWMAHCWHGNGELPRIETLVATDIEEFKFAEHLPRTTLRYGGKKVEAITLGGVYYLSSEGVRGVGMITRVLARRIEEIETILAKVYRWKNAPLEVYLSRQYDEKAKGSGWVFQYTIDNKVAIWDDGGFTVGIIDDNGEWEDVPNGDSTFLRYAVQKAMGLYLQNRFNEVDADLSCRF